ncbi:putative phosphatase-domain-containing protein [Haematococcus lacustris]
MHRAGVDIKILSDCNSIFITHILAGAKIAGAVSEVITNAAAFERLPTSQQQQQQPPSPSQQRQVCSHKLVISPHHSPTAAPHCCPLCPENLCKGSHVRALRRAGTYRHIVYAGDGLNDVCAALALGPHDVILARKGYPLADWLQDAARGKAGTRRPLASVRLWSTHDQLAQEVSRIAAGQAGPA